MSVDTEELRALAAGCDKMGRPHLSRKLLAAADEIDRLRKRVAELEEEKRRWKSLGWR